MQCTLECEGYRRVVLRRVLEYTAVLWCKKPRAVFYIHIVYSWFVESTACVRVRSVVMGEGQGQVYCVIKLFCVTSTTN
jgi:hypothetical protein